MEKFQVTISIDNKDHHRRENRLLQSLKFGDLYYCFNAFRDDKNPNKILVTFEFDRKELAESARLAFLRHSFKVVE